MSVMRWTVRRHGAVGRPEGGAIDIAGGLAAIAVLILAAGTAVMQERIEEAPPVGEAVEARSVPRALATPPTKEFMIGAYAGAPYTYPSDVTIKNRGAQDFTVKDLGWDGEPLEDPIYYGVRVVRWFEGGNRGAMLDFTHSKVLARMNEDAAFQGTLDGAPAPARARIGDIFRKLEFTHGHNMLTLNGLWRLPSLNARLSPYVGIGAGVSLPHSEVQMKTERGRTYEYQYTGPALQALIGLEFRVPRMSYFLEYKFTFAKYEAPLTHRDGSILFVDLWRQWSRWWTGDAPPGGFISTLLASHQVLGGLGVRVGTAPAPAAP
jgi:lipid A oxidase